MISRIFAVAILALLPAAVSAACSESTVEFRPAGSEKATARFTVEIADEWDEIRTGLMHRESLPRSAGMLFVYEQAGPVGFWMKNTLIPLDMVFIGPDGVVDKVHENAQPLDETTVLGGEEIQFVLEINGGLAAMLGIGPGAEMRHPAVDAARAAWPCP